MLNCSAVWACSASHPSSSGVRPPTHTNTCMWPLLHSLCGVQHSAVRPAVCLQGACTSFLHAYRVSGYSQGLTLDVRARSCASGLRYWSPLGFTLGLCVHRGRPEAQEQLKRTSAAHPHPHPTLQCVHTSKQPVHKVTAMQLGGHRRKNVGP